MMTHSSKKRTTEKKKPPRRDVNEAAFDVMQRVIQRSEKGSSKKSGKTNRPRR